MTREEFAQFREIYSYNRETGEFTHRKLQKSYLPNEKRRHLAVLLNSTGYEGREKGKKREPRKFSVITFTRAAWFMVYGWKEIPSSEIITTINGDPYDCRIANLRRVKRNQMRVYYV